MKGVLVLILLMFSADCLAANHNVHEKIGRFTPKKLKVRVGDKVTFINDGRVENIIYSESPGNQFVTKNIKPGDYDYVILKKIGTVIVNSDSCPTMELIIEVF
jgi:plastocyanin